MPVALFERLSKSNTFKPTKRNFNTPEFYKEHPDLAPRNIYLREGRIIAEKDIEKAIRKINRNAKIEEFFNLVSNKIKQLFRIKK